MTAVAPATSTRLSHCAFDTDVWCRCRRLQLNANKTEAIWLGSKSNLTKLSTANTSVQVGSATIHPSAVVRDLGLHLDSELSLKHHVAKVAQPQSAFTTYDDCDRYADT